MTLRELGTVLWPFMHIRIIEDESNATLSVTSWLAIDNDTTDLSPDVLDWPVKSIDLDGFNGKPILDIYVVMEE